MGNGGLPLTGVELVAQNLSGFVGDLDKGNAAVQGFTKNAEDAGKRTSSVSEIMIGALRHVGEIAVDSLLKAGQALLDFGKSSLQLAGDFDDGMQQFRVAAGTQLDDQGFQDFHDLFLQLGKDLPVSTSEVQKAAIEMVKGGLDPATLAAGGLKQNIQFAAAAMDGDLAGAAEISAKIVAGWSDITATAADRSNLLTHATDLLTKAANASSVDVHELSLGLFNVQATAKNAGIGLDDVTTVLAELSGDFASSSEAGNSLANFINRLHPTTKAATEAMESLGLVTKDGGNAFYDAQGNFVGFQKASEILKESLAGLNNEQRQQIMQTIFQKDAMGVAAGLASRGAEGYQQMADSLNNAMGVAEAGTTVQQGYNTALENAMGGLEALKITLGEKLLPIMTSFFNFLNNEVLSTLITFTDAIFGNDEAFAALDPTLQGIVSTIDVLVADVQEIIGAFQQGGASTGIFATRLADLAEDLGAPRDMVTSLISGTQALVSSFQEGNSVTQDFNSVLEDLGGIWQRLTKIVQDVMGGYQAIAQAVLPIVSKFFADHGTEINSFFQAAYDHIIVIINTALDIYDAIVPRALNEIAKWIEEHATGITAVLTGAWNVITGVIDGALAIIEGLFKVVLDIVRGDWTQAWEDLKTMSVAVVLDLQKIIGGFLEIIAGFFDTNLKAIADLWSHNWDEIYKFVTNISWDDIGRFIVDGILQGLGSTWGKLSSWLYDKAKNLVGAALSAIGASSPAKEFMPVGQFAVEGIIEGMGQTWPQLLDTVGELGDDLISVIQDLGSKIQSAIADSFGATESIDRQLAANLDKLQDVLPEYQRYVQGALEQVQNEAMQFTDPAQGAKWFKMRSDQIFEYEKLRKQLDETANAEERDRIQKQMLLINQAQMAAINQFNAQLQAQGSPFQEILDKISELFAGGLAVNDTGPGHDIMELFNQLWNALPHHAMGGDVEENKPSWVGENGPELFMPKIPGSIYPVASPAQIAATQYTGPVGNNYTNNYNMPVYTNNSPGALLQSMAVLSALTPS